MIRTSIAAAVVYALGLSFFDGYRPATLDDPLKTFVARINLATQFCWRKVPPLGPMEIEAALRRRLSRIRRAVVA